MIVRQTAVGWIGVLIDKTCANGSIEFTTDMFGLNQLNEINADKREIEWLLRNMKVNQPHLKNHIRYLETKKSANQ